MSSRCLKTAIGVAWPFSCSGERDGLLLNALAQLSPQTSAGHQVHGNAEQILQRKLEIHDLLKAGARGEFDQQIQVTARPRGAPDHRAEHLQAQPAMGRRDALQRRSQPAQLG